jgi:hypothetical protein
VKSGNADGGKAMTQWRPQEGNICHAGGGSYTGTKFERIAEMARKTTAE